MLILSTMKTEDVIKLYGSQAAAARALGITRSAVSQWGDVVPLATAARLEKITAGKLVLDLRFYDRKLAA
jgi:DNA-binding transcriptional regulator YdaS (Cro superfamily)